LAALLHDVPMPHDGEAQQRHAHHLRAAEYARQLLTARGLGTEAVTNVVHCIEAHRFRGDTVQPQSIEAQCLYDADKLDSIGAIGIGRAFAFAGAYHERLWTEPWTVTPPDDAKPQGDDYTPVHEYVYKLRRILATLYTASARRIGAERHRFMLAFFDRLDAIRITTWWLSALLLGVHFAPSPAPLHAQSDPPPEAPVAQPFQANTESIPPFAPGVVLVGVRGDIVAAAATPWSDLDVLAVEPLPVHLDTENVAGNSASTGDPNVAASGATPVNGYKLTVPVGTEWNAVETLTARGEVVFAEPDWVVQIAQDEPDSGAEVAASDPDSAVAETPFAVSDTLYNDQWYMQRIGISRAWALALAESQGQLDTVKVYIIDTGVDYAHPDLASKVTTGRNYIDRNENAFDDNGHGTHIAGLVAAAVNGAGTVGPGLQVEITPFKALGADGTGFASSIAQAIGTLFCAQRLRMR
jgi:uncharacterized protein